MDCNINIGFMRSLFANLDPSFLGGYKIGYELLPINGLITFLD